MNYIFNFSKLELFCVLQFLSVLIDIFSASKSLEIPSFLDFYKSMYYVELTNHRELLIYLVIYIEKT